VALKGPRFDGHAFAAKALEAGAAAVMVEPAPTWMCHPPWWWTTPASPWAETGRLAPATMPAKLAAITGSNGKTTVKEMVAAILAEEAGADAVLATSGNLNNDIGMPLTLLRLTPAHRYAVIEMGMNHPGELAYLTELARPDVALVNNALRAHLEGLGSVEAVARAKGEIYAGLKPDGIAIVNADDPHAGLWRNLNAGHQILSFGFARGADVRVQNLDDTAVSWQLASTRTSLRLNTPRGLIETTLNVPGEHNLRNAAAACACALALGAGPAAVAAGLAASPASRAGSRATPASWAPPSSTTPTTPIRIPSWRPSRCCPSGPAPASWCWATWANWAPAPPNCTGRWGKRPRPPASNACSAWASCRPKPPRASVLAPCISSASRNCWRKSNAPWART
jgi:UDP-N-acetylmuramoyl-tripeptide--D-alanyl-D-alanine ligase